MKESKKSVSIWIGYLMYLLFALSAITIVLYTVEKYLTDRETELSVKTMIKEVLEIENTINTALSCQKCFLTYYATVPRNSRLDITYNNQLLTIRYRYISDSEYFDSKWHSINGTVINIFVSGSESRYIYTIWKDISIPQDLTVDSSLSISTNSCINISKESTSNGVVLSIKEC